MIRIFAISLFILWSSISYSQTTKDSLSELQSLLDSIPDISLAELGIDTTAEIVPDTLHLVIAASIATDTVYARTCLNQAIELIKAAKYDDAYAKADTAKHIYQMNIGCVSKEVSDCLHQMGRGLHFGGKYDQAIKINHKNLMLRFKLFGLLNPEVALSLNILGLSFQSKNNFDEALKYLHKSLIARIKSLGDWHTDVAQSYYNLGITYYSKGKYDNAIEYSQRSLEFFLQSYGPDHLFVGQAYQNLGLNYNSIGEYDKGLEYSQKCLDNYLRFYGTNHPNVASVYHNLAISYGNKGEYDKSIQYNQLALDIRLKTFESDHPDIAWSYYNLGINYYFKGDYYNALENYLKSLDIFLTTHGSTHPIVGHAFINVGNVYSFKGEYDRGLEYLQKGLSNYLISYGSKNANIGLALQNIGAAYFFKEDYDQSIYYSELALNNFLLNRSNNIAEIYVNIGNSYVFKKEYYRALEHIEMGLNLFLKNNNKNYFSIGKAFNSIGVVYFYLKQYDKSIENLNNALIKYSLLEIKNSDEMGLLYGNLGLNYFLKSDFLKSMHNFRKSNLEFNKVFKKNNSKVISSFLAIGKNYNKLYQLDSSLYYIHQAISGIKSQMSSAISSETKNLYQSKNIPVFEAAIDVSLIKSKQDQHDSLKLKTYEYTELAKASLLQSQIKQTDALTFAGIPDSLLQKEYDLRIDINWREKKRQGLLEKGKTETDTTVLRISSIIFDLKREQEALFETLEKDYPEYYRLKYDTKTISLEDTQQKLLQKDQTMVEYFIGDSSIFIFVVRPDTFAVVQVKKDFTLDSLVRQMQSGLYGYHGLSRDQRKDDLYKKSILEYTNAAHELYNRIVAPVNNLLTSDLVIIPDGVLGYVPFEALLKSKPEKLNQFGTYPYLINDHTISYNYSATLWQEMKNKKHKKEPTKSLVAFAPFYEGSFTVLDSTINLIFDTLPDGRDTTIFQDIVSRKTYAPLPSSGIEAGTVSKMYNGEYFINSDATEQKFYDVAGDYRFVHLSTHGVADARQGDYSYLAFAEQKDSIENEFLYVRDIYNTQLNADLVFLSACETAQGELQRGEGIISLARAFAYAGAKSIITTLWQVDDTATKDISIDFYKNLKNGFTKDVALRQAKLRHIKSAKSVQKHPFFWAAMIGIGDMGGVK